MNEDPKRLTIGESTHPALDCPRCGGNNLHHWRVEVYERPEEDGPVTKTSVESRSFPADIQTAARSKREPTDNPSARRNGLSVSFWCEGCAEISVLGIAQHKGCTLVEWK